MKAFDVTVRRTVEDTVPVYIDTPQEAQALVENSLSDDETAEVVNVTLNEFWTEQYRTDDLWPPYDSEGCYLERTL